MAFLRFKDNIGLSGDTKNYWLMSHQLADTGIYGYWYDGSLRRVSGSQMPGSCRRTRFSWL